MLTLYNLFTQPPREGRPSSSAVCPHNKGTMLGYSRSSSSLMIALNFRLLPLLCYSGNSFQVLWYYNTIKSAMVFNCF